MITDEFASIQKRIHDHGFKRLLLAVSGGLDSICLAHYFIANSETLGIEWLGIAHVHHGLREETADRDAAFVEAFAKAHNVPFFLKKLDGEALKNAEGSLEENARDARYKALQESAENCDAIVTAHHAGDQAETMYMRLRRGTTLAGLRGIQDVRDNIYRPFLNVTREELLAYAHENNLKWCEDESNSDVKFARNKVRHEFLPQLEKECTGANAQLCRIAPLADKVYTKVIAKCDAIFRETLRQAQGDTAPFSHLKGSEATDLTPHTIISLNKKALRKVLLTHEGADLSEMFRLWLSEQGFRFPIGFFYDQKEPAHVKIPIRAAYRKRSIVKKGSTVLICEFEDVQTASKFVSCGMKE